MPAQEPVLPATPSRLQIAQRVHQALLREIGHGIEIERLLGDERYGRDVLLVCDACPGNDLQALALLFRSLPMPVLASAQPAQPAQPAQAAPGSEFAPYSANIIVSRPA